MPEFKIGDTVQLKSGGPVMTVHNMDKASGEGGVISCMPQRPETLDGSSVDFCSLAIFIVTGRSFLRKFLQQHSRPQIS